MPKTLSRVLVALGGVTTLGLLASLSSLESACAQRVCEGSGLDWGRIPTQGELIDENTWESTPELSDWLDYPGERTVYFYPHGLERRRIARVTVYISANGHPNVAKFGEPTDPVTSQYTIASGDVAQITTFPDPADPLNPAVGVHNHTCAEFWTRVIIEAYPASASDAGVDAGADADASNDGASDARVLDAQGDGPNDGASE